MCSPTYGSGSASIDRTVPMPASVPVYGTAMLTDSHPPGTASTPSPGMTVELLTESHAGAMTVGSQSGVVRYFHGSPSSAPNASDSAGLFGPLSTAPASSSVVVALSR